MKTPSKKLLIILGVVVVLVVVIYQLFAGNYNKLVKLEENVETAWAQVQNQYQRRYDLSQILLKTRSSLQRVWYFVQTLDCETVWASVLL